MFFRALFNSKTAVISAWYPILFQWDAVVVVLKTDPSFSSSLAISRLTSTNITNLV